MVLVVKNPPVRCEFYPRVEKIPWRRAGQPTPVFLPGESYGQRSLAGYSPWGHREPDMTEVTEQISWYSGDEHEFFVMFSIEKGSFPFPLILKWLCDLFLPTEGSRRGVV